MLKTKGNPLKVHSKVHFLKMNYSIGFYTGGGNIEDWGKLTKDEQKAKLLKDWYVWWSFRNPETQLLERQEPNIKLGINGHKTKTARLNAMLEVKRELKNLLKTGYSPYDLASAEPELISIEFAFDEALKVKKNEVKETTYKDYESRINQFKNYLKKNGYDKVKEIDKKIVSTFLSKFNASNSNNFRAALSSIFTILSERSYIDVNFVKELRTKKQTIKAVKIYSENDIKNVTDLLKKQDQELLMHVYLISYMFWRPIEIVRIEIKDIDFANMRMTVNTKAKDFKTKIIPEIIKGDLIDFIGNRKGKLFELKAVSDIDKRGQLTGKFSRFRKRNKIDAGFKIYSFRHTFITKLYLEFRSELSKEDAVKKLSLITGHTSKALFNYIQVNDIELPDDYSHHLK